MSDEPESCESCGRFTERGKQQRAEAYRKRPLSGIDLARPLSGLIAEIRSGLVQSRGQLQDIGWGYPGWADRPENVQGLLTCGLIALYGVMQEMQESEKRSLAEPADPVSTPGEPL